MTYKIKKAEEGGLPPSLFILDNKGIEHRIPTSTKSLRVLRNIMNTKELEGKEVTPLQLRMWRAIRLITAERKRQRLSITATIALAGIARNRIFTMESGKNPTAETVILVSAALGNVRTHLDSPELPAYDLYI